MLHQVCFLMCDFCHYIHVYVFYWEYCNWSTILFSKNVQYLFLSSLAATQSEDEIRTSSPIQQDTLSVCQIQLEEDQCSPSKPQAKESHTNGEDSLISEVIIISCTFFISLKLISCHHFPSWFKPHDLASSLFWFIMVRCISIYRVI